MEIGFSFVDLLTGGGLGLISASAASHFGMRAAERLPGETRLPLCVFCQRPLQLHEYFPLFGWLFRMKMLRLPCPCGKRTGLWPQPLIELVGFLFGALAVGLAGFSPDLVPVCLGLGLLPAIAMIDLAFGLIPDGLNLLLGLCGFSALIIGQAGLSEGLVNTGLLLALGLFFALGYSRLRKREMLGLGDVKFFAAAGPWLSLDLTPWFLVLAGVLGLGVGFLWRKSGGGREFPFGPALCLSLAGCVFWQLHLYALT